MWAAKRDTFKNLDGIRIFCNMVRHSGVLWEVSWEFPKADLVAPLSPGGILKFCSDPRRVMNWPKLANHSQITSPGRCHCSTYRLSLCFLSYLLASRGGCRWRLLLQKVSAPYRAMGSSLFIYFAPNRCSQGQRQGWPRWDAWGFYHTKHEFGSCPQIVCYISLAIMIPRHVAFLRTFVTRRVKWRGFGLGIPFQSGRVAP